MTSWLEFQSNMNPHSRKIFQFICQPVNYEPFIFGFVIHITIFFGYLMPFGLSPALAVFACFIVIGMQIYISGSLDKRILIFLLAVSVLVTWGILNRVILTSSIGNTLYRTANYYLTGVLLILATVHVVKYDENRLASFLNGLLVVAVIAILIAFVNYFTSLFMGIDFLIDLKRPDSIAQYHRSRMMGTFGNPNNFAAALLVPFIIILTRMIESLNFKGTIIFTLCFAAIVFASSRGIILAVFAMFPFAVWKAREKKNFSKFVLLLITPFVLSTLLLLMGDHVERIAQLLDRIFAGEGKVSVYHRFNIWTDYAHAFMQNPRILIIGNGLDSFPVDHPPESGYLKLINEFGILSTLVLVSMPVVICANIVKKQSQSFVTRLVFYLIVSSMIANLTNEFIDCRSFWLAMAISYTCWQMSRHQPTTFQCHLKSNKI